MDLEGLKAGSGPIPALYVIDARWVVIRLSHAVPRVRDQRREKSASSRPREKVTIVGRPWGQVSGVFAA